MTLGEFADIIGKQIEITRYPNQKNRHIARFGGAEVKEGGCLAGYFGTGHTPEKALENYVDRIAGKTLVFNAMSKEKRREYNVPKALTT